MPEVYVYPVTPVVTAKELAAARAASRKAKALASIAHNTLDTYVNPQGFTVTVLAGGQRGRNARGLAAARRGWGGSQPKGAKRAKRQRLPGNVPAISSTRWGF